MPDLALLPAAAAASTADELAWAAATLRAAGIADPRRESLRLWSALAGVAPGAVWLARRQPADPACARRFRVAVRRRAAGTPLAHAVGRAAFRTLDLASDGRALIPRPETEGLVELVLAWARRAPGGSGGIAADLGTGSGCIALALAVEGRFDRVIATDRSPDALALARENLARIAPCTPVELRLGDWLAPLRAERCRVLVANPPYLRDDEWAALDPAVRAYEPREALASGPDGLGATRVLLREGPATLAAGGLLALEVDERRATAIAVLARETGWREVAVHHDLFGRPRYVLAVVGEDS